VQTVAEVPHDAVAELEAQAVKHGVEQDIQGQDVVVVYVVPHLPADAAGRRQRPDALADHRLLPAHVLVEIEPRPVGLSQIVRGRRHHEAGQPVR